MVNFFREIGSVPFWALPRTSFCWRRHSLKDLPRMTGLRTSFGDTADSRHPNWILFPPDTVYGGPRTNLLLTFLISTETHVFRFPRWTTPLESTPYHVFLYYRPQVLFNLASRGCRPPLERRPPSLLKRQDRRTLSSTLWDGRVLRISVPAGWTILALQGLHPGPPLLYSFIPPFGRFAAFLILSVRLPRRHMTPGPGLFRHPPRF